jgi:hypothetical protein
VFDDPLLCWKINGFDWWFVISFWTDEVSLSDFLIDHTGNKLLG